MQAAAGIPGQSSRESKESQAQQEGAAKELKKVMNVDCSLMQAPLCRQAITAPRIDYICIRRRELS